MIALSATDDSVSGNKSHSAVFPAIDFGILRKMHLPPGILLYNVQLIQFLGGFRRHLLQKVQ
ncbi:hypothetical protein D3C73_1215520 [compost metagenome]